ncbi:fimbrial protein [Salmonella enterica]|nr:fimbrial protein [Salmonella enterica subsp. enterica serovar Kentucky]
MKLNWPTLLITLNILTLLVETTEFSADSLKSSDHLSVDLSAFSRDGYIAPGVYLLDIYVNDRLIYNQ